jgi:peptidoglycan/LPS O-acetylase OafA/YrhL
LADARLPGLDAARALAVGLVIGVHALLPFMQTPVGWAIRDEPRHELVDLTVWVARSFVIPAFFWLSGFLSRAAIESRGLAGFVRQRMARVGVPFLLLVWPNSLALGALWDRGRALQPRPAVAAQLPQLRGTGLAVSLGHLWFLYYLLLVSAGAVALVLVARAARRALAGSGRGPSWAAAGEPSRWLSRLGPLAVAVPLSALLSSAGKLQLDTPLSFAIDPVIALAFGLFFAWGWRAQGRPAELSALGRRPWVWLALALPLLALIIPSLRDSAAAPAASAAAGTAGGPPVRALAASAAFSVLTTAAFIGLCLRHVTRRRRALEVLARASYFCYLVHLPLLVALQIALAGEAGPATLKFGAALGCTLAVCLVCYFAFAAIADRLQRSRARA